MIHRSMFLGLLLAAGGACAQTAAAPPAGRLLASNCFQCHGTNGSGGFDRLAGMAAQEVVGELREMRTKTTPGIMEVHARGYTDAQLQLIGNYFASLGRNTTTQTSGGTAGTTQSTASTTQSTATGEKDDD